MFSTDKWTHKRIHQSYLRHHLSSVIPEKYLVTSCLVHIWIMIFISCGKHTRVDSSPYCFFCSSELSDKNYELWIHDKLGELEKNPLMPVLH